MKNQTDTEQKTIWTWYWVDDSNIFNWDL